MEGLEAEDPDLVEQIRRLMFVFEDILLVNDKGIQSVLKEVDNEELSLALKTASEELKQKIFKNMSERAAQLIQEDMQYMGPVRRERRGIRPAEDRGHRAPPGRRRRNHHRRPRRREGNGGLTHAGHQIAQVPIPSRRFRWPASRITRGRLFCACRSSRPSNCWPRAERGGRTEESGAGASCRRWQTSGFGAGLEEGKKSGHDQALAEHRDKFAAATEA